MSKPRYGPSYRQTDKYGKPKCKTHTVANGGIPIYKKLKGNNDESRS